MDDNRKFSDLNQLGSKVIMDGKLEYHSATRSTFSLNHPLVFLTPAMPICSYGSGTKIEHKEKGSDEQDKSSYINQKILDLVRGDKLEGDLDREEIIGMQLECLLDKDSNYRDLKYVIDNLEPGESVNDDTWIPFYQSITALAWFPAFRILREKGMLKEILYRSNAFEYIISSDEWECPFTGDSFDDCTTCEDKIKLLDLFVDMGMDVEYKFNSEYSSSVTLLHKFSTREEDLPVLKKLLDLNLDPMKNLCRDNLTPIQWAIIFGNEEAVKLYFYRGYDISLENMDEKSMISDNMHYSLGMDESELENMRKFINNFIDENSGMKPAKKY